MDKEPLTAENRPYPVNLLFAAAFLAVYCSTTELCHLTVYPGYFLLQTLSLLLLFHWLIRHRHSLPPPLFHYALLPFAWACLSLCWCAQTWAAAEGLRRMTTLVLMMFGFSHLLRLCPTLRDNLWNIVLAILSFLAAVYSMEVHRVGRLESFHFLFGNPNVAGCILGFGGAFAMGRALCYYREGRWKLVLGNAAIAGWLISVVAVSARAKGAFLAAVLTGVALLYLACGRKFLRFALYSIAAIETALFTSLYLAFDVTARVWDSMMAILRPSAEIRLYVWESTWNMISSSPFRFCCGWGPGNFFPNFPDFEDPLMYTAQSQASLVIFPHNFSLEILAEYGAIGLALSILLILKIAGAAMAHQTADCRQRANALGALAALFMLAADAQVSVAFSYLHAQMLFALLSSWLISFRPWHTISPRAPLRMSYKIASACAVVLGIFLWKICAWDSLYFHYNYNKAARIYRETFSASSRLVPDAEVRATASLRALETMLAVPPPLCRDSYSCAWRNRIGMLLLDCPYPPRKALCEFLYLERQLPHFSTFWLTRACFAAKQNNTREADLYFARFARRNPFSPDLWHEWRRACDRRAATPENMLATARELQKTYGREPGLLLGEALALDMSHQKSPARKILQEIHHWSLGQRLNHRAEQIKTCAEFYLQ